MPFGRSTGTRPERLRTFRGWLITSVSNVASGSARRSSSESARCSEPASSSCGHRLLRRPAPDSLVGLVIAGVVAFCNATSSAPACRPLPGVRRNLRDGRRCLGTIWGYVAGWCFVVGKTASCAAMALTVGNYAWPDQSRLVATGAVIAIVGVNIAGLTCTVAVTRVTGRRHPRRPRRGAGRRMVWWRCRLRARRSRRWRSRRAARRLLLLRLRRLRPHRHPRRGGASTRAGDPRAIVWALTAVLAPTSPSASPCSPPCPSPTSPPAMRRCSWWSTVEAGRRCRR